MTTDYGHDRSVTLRTVVLPFPDGTTRAVTAVQSSLDQSEVSGRACLTEALVRRLVTYRGTLIDVLIPSTTADYGTTILDFVNDDMTPRDIAMAGASVDAELRKDERVIRSTTPASLAGEILMLPITVYDAAGPFKLVFAVSQASVQLLSVP
jgi:hypothetical protein